MEQILLAVAHLIHEIQPDIDQIRLQKRKLQYEDKIQKISSHREQIAFLTEKIDACISEWNHIRLEEWFAVIIDEEIRKNVVRLWDDVLLIGSVLEVVEWLKN
jgi:hypothetical protein